MFNKLFWKKFEIQVDQIIFSCRKCNGKIQVLRNGPWGDDAWHDINEPWAFDHEKDSFFKGLARHG